MSETQIAYCGLDCETCAGCPDKAGCKLIVPFLDNKEAKSNLGL